MEAFGLLTLAATVIKIVSVVKAVGKDSNFVLTQVVTWWVGIIVLFLAAFSDLGGGIEVFGSELQDFDALSLVLAGLALGSTGSFAYDYKKARDNSDTAAEPPLVRETSPTSPPLVWAHSPTPTPAELHEPGCVLSADHLGVCRTSITPATRAEARAGERVPARGTGGRFVSRKQPEETE